MTSVKYLDLASPSVFKLDSCFGLISQTQSKHNKELVVALWLYNIWSVN